jgi:hypothetical protein
MTAVRMLPKCSAGYCGWRDCRDEATSATFRMRISHSIVADVRFCGEHKRYAIPGPGGIMPTARAAVWAVDQAAA